MNTKIENTTRFVATFALVAAFAVGAQAADVAQRKVKYDDLNVRNTAGATVLYQRIRGAAIAVCGDAGKQDLARASQTKACIDHAIAQAVASVNAPALTGVYTVKTGGAQPLRFAAN